MYGSVYFVWVIRNVKTEHHGNFLRNLFRIDSAHFFHDWKSFRWVASRAHVWRFIRSCQNPIGRAQPKNWNLWLCIYREGTAQKLKSMALPYTTKVWKKNDRILCWLDRDWWQSYRGMSRDIEKILFLL